MLAGDMMVMAAALYTLGSVTIPSLASVYNELALKKHMETSIDLQNWCAVAVLMRGSVPGTHCHLASAHLQT